MDEGFDKMNINFIGIETLYGKCESLFSPKSQLHKYLKNGCIGLVQLFLPDTPTLALPILIINLKSVVSVMGSGLIFQKWTYITAAVILVLQVFPVESNFSATTYLNTACDITFVDKNWLLW